MEREEFNRFRSSEVAFFSRLKPRNIFPGEWESSDRGEGIEFAEIKPFEPGDDLRDIDLQALVQSGEEEVVLRVVERQMKMYVWLDLSGSMRSYSQMFFAQKPAVRDTAIGLLFFSACNSYNPVGLYAFNQQTSRFFSARVGETHCWEMIHWIMAEDRKMYSAGSSLQAALSAISKQAAPRSLVFLVSDFEDAAFDADFTSLFHPVINRFDLVPVIIQDPLETTARLKRPVLLSLLDSEGKNREVLYLTPGKLADIQKAAAARLRRLENQFLAFGIRPVVLNSPSVEDCYRVLSGYFQARRGEFR